MTPKQKELPEVSVKSTKDQILSAYHEVLERLENKQIQNPQEEKKQLDEKAIIQKSSQTSADAIISNLATLKISLGKQIDTLSENLVGEFDKLSDLKQAISLEQEHLHNLYEIKETAHTLSALILAQREQAEAFSLKTKDAELVFEQEMEEKKAFWKKQHTQLEAGYAEKKETLEKQHTREEENYAYTLEISRRQDLHDYALKKEALEKELEDRRQELVLKEAEIEGRLQEFEQLTKKVDKFPEELISVIERTTNEVTEKLEMQYKFTASLKDKEIEGERKLHLQKIASLEARLKEQDALIIQLTKKADEAIHQVEAIACRALETSSQRQPYAILSDKGISSTQERIEK